MSTLESVTEPAADPEVIMTPAEAICLPNHALDPGSAVRRVAIAYYFVEVYGSPPKEKWTTVVTDLMSRLCMPLGSRDTVYSVFRSMAQCQLAKQSF